MSIQNTNLTGINPLFLKSMRQNLGESYIKPHLVNQAQNEILVAGFSQLHKDLVQLSTQIANAKK